MEINGNYIMKEGEVMYDPKELWKEVEWLQEILHETVSKKGSTSPEATRAIHAFRNKMKEYTELMKRELIRN
jgi:hypothetical protein